MVTSVGALAGCKEGAEAGGIWECDGQTIDSATPRHAEVDVEVRPVGEAAYEQHYSGGCAPVHKLPGTPTGDELCEWPTTQSVDGSQHATAYFSFDTPEFMLLQIILQGDPTLEDAVVWANAGVELADESVGGNVSVELVRHETAIGPVFDVDVVGELSDPNPGAVLESVAVDGTLCFLDAPEEP